jgi:hypothetical protein
MIGSVTSDYLFSVVTLITKFADVPVVTFLLWLPGYRYSLVARFRQTRQKCFVLLTFPTFLFVSNDIYTQQYLFP